MMLSYPLYERDWGRMFEEYFRRKCMDEHPACQRLKRIWAASDRRYFAKQYAEAKRMDREMARGARRSARASRKPAAR